MDNVLYEGHNGFDPSLWNVETLSAAVSIQTVDMEHNR